MTIYELVKELQKYPQDFKVMLFSIDHDFAFEIKFVEQDEEQDTIYIVLDQEEDDR